jgi:uncharacterized ParB-like nuclease family protein
MNGRHKTIAFEIATDAVRPTAGIKILGAEKIAIEVPTFTCSAANVSISFEASDSLAGTYRPVHALTVNSAASGVALWQTLAGTGPLLAVCEPIAGMKYIKPVLSLTTTVSVAGKVHVMN